ncbi:hypothetical protein L610_006100000120 [Aminobacter sp. J44]|nr:hypothetical protein L610_006100000120 [Aminobacter sp. J44]
MPQAGTRVFARFPAVTVKPWTWQSFALAGLCAAVAAGVRLVTGVFEPSAPPFPAFLFATMVTAIVGGAAAGIVCAALGLALSAWMLSAHVPDGFTAPALIQYALVSTLIIWIAYEYRRLLRHAQDRQQEAERQMALIEAENATLNMMAADRPLKETLTSLVRTIEQYSKTGARVDPIAGR